MSYSKLVWRFTLTFRALHASQALRLRRITGRAGVLESRLNGCLCWQSEPYGGNISDVRREARDCWGLLTAYIIAQAWTLWYGCAGSGGRRGSGMAMHCARPAIGKVTRAQSVSWSRRISRVSFAYAATSSQSRAIIFHLQSCKVEKKCF